MSYPLENAKENLGKDSFTCALCGETYEKERDGWSQEQAVAEKEAYFPQVSMEDCGIVCDDCYTQIGIQ